MKTVRAVTVLFVLAAVACPRPGGVGRSDADTVRPGTEEPASTEAGPAAEASPTVRGATPEPEPAPPTPGTCALTGPGLRLARVVDADLVGSATGSPRVLVVVERPWSERLAMEGDEPFPDVRALYLVAPRPEGPPDVTLVADDPGPIRDTFGRIAYERLAAVRGTCESGTCLVATAVERLTPGAPGSAFTVLLTLLDRDGEVQGPTRRLAQEPDRGEAVAACLGASDEGFVLATSVRGGRGRALWLDRRATPLGVTHLPEGFESCAAMRSGLHVLVAAATSSGIETVELGAGQVPDAGPEPELPVPPAGASAPGLVELDGRPVLLFVESRGLHALRRGDRGPLLLLPGEIDRVGAVAVGSGALVVGAGGGRVAACRLEGDEVVAVEADLAEGDRAWVATGPRETSWLAWRQEDRLRIRQLSCGRTLESGGASPEDREVDATALDGADRAGAPALRQRARAERTRGRAFRAAWMLERAFALDGADPTTLAQAAALLTGIRYTQAARRILTRLATVDSNEARTALRATCRDRDFESQWATGEFQRITGCAPPTERPGAAPAEAPPGDASPER